MLTAVTLLLCIGAGVVGGVFFAFSSFVMKALAQLPANQGVAAMQRINVVVLNPLFLGVFLGTALLAVAGVVLSVLTWSTPRSVLLLASSLLYLIGTFLVTMAFNVPRNESLARLNPSPRKPPNTGCAMCASGHSGTTFGQWPRLDRQRAAQVH